MITTSEYLRSYVINIQGGLKETETECTRRKQYRHFRKLSAFRQESMAALKARTTVSKLEFDVDLN